MSEATDLVRRYLAAWNENDNDARRASVAAVWAHDGCHLDPLAEVTGHDEISALMGAVQQQVPGHVFRLLELVPADDGESIAEGFDVAVIDDDGRIGSVLGFVDTAPTA